MLENDGVRPALRGPDSATKLAVRAPSICLTTRWWATDHPGVSSAAARGRVLVLTPDLESAVGGVKIHYQVVDALNAAGVPAAVVHLRPGFRCAWFNNATRIEYVESLQLAANDVVVVPEEWIQYIPLLPPQLPKVVFNQNAYS